MHKQVLKLALPSILANITIPLVGIVDVAIVGHIANATAIGGIAIGTMLFDLMYWNFGFLRVGTSGLTAQAYGRKDWWACSTLLGRSLRVAVIAALCLWVVQWLFVTAVLWCVPCSAEVAQFARQYFFVRIWAAPATLALMAFKGWFIGMQNTVAPMVTDIVVNVMNMAASYYLAVYTPMGGIGVAYGTLVAQYVGLLTAIGLLVGNYHALFEHIGPGILRFGKTEMAKSPSLFRFNSQLFLRSLCFMVIYVGFTTLTSRYGDEELALSNIIMKLFLFFSYFADGFAYAGEALVGRYMGAGDNKHVNAAVRVCLLWSGLVGVGFTLIYWIAGQECIAIMTSDASVLSIAPRYQVWLVVMPIVSVLAFMWDGIYIGATRAKDILMCMVLAALAFVMACLLQPLIGIQAVYLGYFLHLLVRTAYLSARRSAWLSRG